MAPPLVYHIQKDGLEQTVAAQEVEYGITKEQTYHTNDKTYLYHMLLFDETSSVSQCVGRCTDGEHHTY